MGVTNAYISSPVAYIVPPALSQLPKSCEASDSVAALFLHVQ